MKQEFIDFLNALMEAAPDVVKEKMNDNVKAYIDALIDKKGEKPALTDNGKMVLKYLQNAEPGLYKAKDIADGLFVASRNVSGAMRKLVSDGFVEKGREKIYSQNQPYNQIKYHHGKAFCHFTSGHMTAYGYG